MYERYILFSFFLFLTENTARNDNRLHFGRAEKHFIRAEKRVNAHWGCKISVENGDKPVYSVTLTLSAIVDPYNVTNAVIERTRGRGTLFFPFRLHFQIPAINRLKSVLRLRTPGSVFFLSLAGTHTHTHPHSIMYVYISCILFLLCAPGGGFR